MLKPRDARSTVRKVTIAIDAEHFVPLRVQVFGHGSGPGAADRLHQDQFHDAVRVDVRVQGPGRRDGVDQPVRTAGPFRRTPPPTASVGPATPKPAPKYLPRHASAQPKIIGSGWTSIVEIPAGSGGGAGPAGALGSLPRELTTAGSNGQRVLHTALVNAVLLPDGRTFVGAVSQSLLEHVAATTPN